MANEPRDYSKPTPIGMFDVRGTQFLVVASQESPELGYIDTWRFSFLPQAGQAKVAVVSTNLRGDERATSPITGDIYTFREWGYLVEAAWCALAGDVIRQHSFFARVTIQGGPP